MEPEEIIVVSREQKTILADSVLEMNGIGAADSTDIYREQHVMAGISEHPGEQQISRIVIKVQIHDS